MQGLRFGWLAVPLLSLPLLARAGTWTEQVSNSPQELYAVSATTDQVAWAGGDAGMVVRTVDGGSTWEQRPAPSASITAIFALDAQACVIGDQSGRLWRTVDGGIQWDQVADGGSYINGVHFFDALQGWAVGDPAGGIWVILESSDGGASWTPSPAAPPAGPGFGLTGSFDWIGSQVGVFGTSQWVVWRTTNGGAEWVQVTTHVRQVAGLVLSDSGVGLAGGDLARLDRSTDAGASWEEITSPTGARLLTFDWIDGTQEVWGSTHQSGLYQSTNAGLGWTQHAFLADYIAEDLDFAGRTAGWSVGSGPNGEGRIWRYSDPVAVVDAGAPPARPRAWAHPNPFTARTAFGFGAPATGRVEILVHDASGRMVTCLSGGSRGVLVWDGRDARGRPLPSGIYYYQVRGASNPEGGLAGRVVKVR